MDKLADEHTEKMLEERVIEIEPERLRDFEAHGYKDSVIQIENCKNSIKDSEYEVAIALMEKGDYEGAKAAFEVLDGYKDSLEIMTGISLDNIRKSSIGDTILFGRFDQDGKEGNGKEEIEWIILDKTEDAALVISKYALENREYNNPSSYAPEAWDTCSLRSWLNKVFIKEGFSEIEQTYISEVTITTSTNTKIYHDPNEEGYKTKDKIFVLSDTEAEELFASGEDRQCTPSEHAVINAKENGRKNDNVNEYCCWWLRTPGRDKGDLDTVDCSGNVNPYGCSVDNYAIYTRPAMWISFSYTEESEFSSEEDDEETVLTKDTENVYVNTMMLGSKGSQQTFISN